MKRIYILGVNGNARDILDAIRLICRTHPNFPKPAGFLDDCIRQGAIVDGIPVVGNLESAYKLQNACFVNAIGSPESYILKPSIITKTGVPDTSFISVIHPKTDVSPSAKIGHGSVILSNTSVGAGVKIGNHVMILQNCVISHETRVADYAVIATGICLSGNVKIEKGSYLGSQCCVRGGINVGTGVLIGMGSVVVRDVPSHEVWCGNPARRLRKVAKYK